MTDVVDVVTALSVQSLQVAALLPMLVDVMRSQAAEQLCSDVILVLTGLQRLSASRPAQAAVKRVPQQHTS